ncbi:4-alpha-glucanotransferase, partial [Burkholderia sp. E168m23]
AIAMTSTHDLPTVAGWWRGVDLGWRRVAAEAEAAKRRDETQPRDIAAPEPDDASAHDSDEIVQSMAYGHDTVQRPDSNRSTPPPPPELLAAHAERAAERAALWRALQAAGCAPAGAAVPPTDMPPVNAILGYVASSPSPLALLPLEDLLALDAQPNLPGPPCGHPNWRQRLPRTIDALFDADVRTR